MAGAAAGIGNPAGFVNLFDGGTPRIITAYARANLSGGVFVVGSTAAGVVSSGAKTFTSDDIKVVGDASGNACNGVAVYSAASGATIGVATRGLIIAQAVGTVTCGVKQVVTGINATQDITTGSVSAAITGSGIETPVGRAWTGATSGLYYVLDLNL